MRHKFALIVALVWLLAVLWAAELLQSLKDEEARQTLIKNTQPNLPTYREQ